MRGRSSSKQGRISRVGGSMEKDKVDKVKEEPHLSGAYIRSLVKHLTSTRTKDPCDGDGRSRQVLNTNGKCFGDHNDMQQESPPPPPQHKKQVRRRQHTSRPYQERLLNMAEARREIVTALKFHRASMKQQEAANNHDLLSSQTHPQLEQSPPPQSSLGQEGNLKSRRNPRAYPSTTTNYLEHCSGLSCLPSVPYHSPISTIAPPPPLPPLYRENLNFTLPNQTLGLNLNFQDFKNLDTQLYHNPLSIYSSSSASSSSSPSTSSSAAFSVATEEVAVGMPEEVVANSSGGVIINGGVGSNLHHAMDDEEMEEIRSLGEQHQMEWNDTVNLVMSARWFKFLKTMEIGPENGKVAGQKDEYDGFDPFNQVTEFPPCLQQQFDDHFSDDYLQDPALPCMDIGEIKGRDGEWLA